MFCVRIRQQKKERGGIRNKEKEVEQERKTELGNANSQKKRVEQRKQYKRFDNREI